MTRSAPVLAVVLIAATAGACAVQSRSPEPLAPDCGGRPVKVHHRFVGIDGLDLFYREAGDTARPTVLLLHGFPTSSHMFRNLLSELGDEFHLVASDYPGYGNSSMPAVDDFEYTFDRLETIEFHLLHTGHFALEEDGGVIAGLMRRFLREHVG